MYRKSKYVSYLNRSSARIQNVCLMKRIRKRKGENKMGVVKTITYENFPKQNEGTFGVGARVSVCYHYNTNKTHEGTIVRDDKEEPFETIIRLDNGRFLRGTECQYRPLN